MKYADPEAQAEIDRLRTQLRLAEQDEAEMARRLVSCRKAGDEMVGEIEKLEAELDWLRKVLLAEWEKDRKTYAELMQRIESPRPLTWDCCGATAGEPHKSHCYTRGGR